MKWTREELIAHRKQQFRAPSKPKCRRKRIQTVNGLRTFRKIAAKLGISYWQAQDDFTRGIEKIAVWGHFRRTYGWEVSPEPGSTIRCVSVECNQQFRRLYAED